jgi:chorismate lyase/3-hydroxybenzoate synthase
VSINVFLSKKLPKKRDNILSAILFNNKISFSNNILSTGISCVDQKDIYEIWEVDGIVEQKKFNKINIAKSKDYIFGFSIIEKTGTFEELKLKIKNEYDEIFKIIKQEKMDIIKIWHYFPDLLKSYSDKKTNYSLLCEAREIIFKDYYTDFSYPAATVIGIEGDKILIYFLAASCKKYDVIENKRQVSSYDYPQNIFFEKPMFSRAVKFISKSCGGEKIVISGTASIKGYETLHSDEVLKQLDEALRNYKTFVGIKNNSTNICRIYLSKSQENNYSDIVKKLDKEFGNNQYLVLKGDICRKDLLIELEGISNA